MSEHECKYCGETFRTGLKLYAHHEYTHQDEWVDEIIEAMKDE